MFSARPQRLKIPLPHRLLRFQCVLKPFLVLRIRLVAEIEDFAEELLCQLVFLPCHFLDGFDRILPET
jgi:hypothetical protein